MRLDLFPTGLVWALYIALGALLLFFSTWVFFVAIMNLKRVRNAGQLTPASRVLGLVVEAIGLVLDLSLNWLIAPLLFLEVGREVLLSARITRLVAQDPNGWRGRLALLLRTQLLDNIDPAGVHRG